MPMHDWTRVSAGIYHNFRFHWVTTIVDRLNAGVLPVGYFAMAERIHVLPETDELVTDTIAPSDAERYARRASQIVVHARTDKVVAEIVIASPGNKATASALRSFVEEATDLLKRGVNLLLIDPIPPGSNEPRGIHGAIWQEHDQGAFELPPDKPLLVVTYEVQPRLTAFIESVAVDDRLPDVPLFLERQGCITVPLEETYEKTWRALPLEIRTLVEYPPGS